MIKILLGAILPMSLLFTGIFFLIYLKGYPFRSPSRLRKAIFLHSNQAEISPTQALLTALAGTLGVGNISGVAAALSLGGAGALFWMWVCALFAMIVKYAEIVLALDRHKDRHGGAMYYIKHKAPAVVFAILCLCCGLTMGNLIQIRAAAGSVTATFGRGNIAIAILFAISLPTIILKGKRGVFYFAEKAVPTMTILYCTLTVIYLILSMDKIPAACKMILQDAFSLRAAGGGITGSVMIAGLRYGASRGMLSNEAGCGTAPIAHAASENTPAAQGCLGIAEVFIDTFLLCTLTGLCILTSSPLKGNDGTSLVFNAFKTRLGDFSGFLLTPAMIIFAFATVVCWYYYCTECLYFLTGNNRYEKIFAIFFSATCLIAPFIPEERLFISADLLIFFMTMINLPTLIINKKCIRRHTLDYFQNK